MCITMWLQDLVQVQCAVNMRTVPRFRGLTRDERRGWDSFGVIARRIKTQLRDQFVAIRDGHLDFVFFVGQDHRDQFSAIERHRGENCKARARLRNGRGDKLAPFQLRRRQVAAVH